MEIDNNFYGVSDAALIEQIGSYLKDVRLQQNKTQQEVATSAGINRTTLVQIEKGKGGTLTTLIQILRVLGELSVLAGFRVQRKPSPMILAEMEMSYRRRARHKGTDTSTDTDTDW